MIIVVVGPSHAGKTSFVTNSFIKGECRLYKDIVWVTECDSAYLIGNYVADKRARGSDMIARQDVKKIKDQVLKLAERGDKDIIMEGDKVCSHPLLDALLKDFPRTLCLYLVTCSLENSVERNKRFNSTVDIGVLKRAKTKSENLFNDYCDEVLSGYVVTDDIEDFTKFSFSTAEVIYGRKFDQREHLF